MKRILFLDFDGCLNSEEHLPDDEKQTTDIAYYFLDRRLCRRINRLSKLLDEVVISSDWRLKFSLREIISYLSEAGAPELAEKVSGVTPRSEKGSHARVEEIQQYLDLRKEALCFVIVDDFLVDGLPWHSRQVAINGKTGITDADLYRVEGLLRQSQLSGMA